jgi:hypothetical protein
MESKIRVLNGITIDYSKSSVQVFPALKDLENSNGLYLKFSKNHIKTMAIENHAKLSLDFDLCLIDAVMNETIIQLFAIFAVTKDQEPVNEWSYVQEAVDFARSLVMDAIKNQDLLDKSGNLVQVPAFALDPASINFSF